MNIVWSVIAANMADRGRFLPLTIFHDWQGLLYARSGPFNLIRPKEPRPVQGGLALLEPKTGADLVKGDEIP